MFLRRADRDDEAKTLFTAMLEEAPHLSRRERRYSGDWLFLYQRRAGQNEQA